MRAKGGANWNKCAPHFERAGNEDVNLARQGWIASPDNLQYWQKI
jgi:hypothetical protein